MDFVNILSTQASMSGVSFPDTWRVLPLYAIAKIKSICECTDLQLLSVYLDAGVVPFATRTEKRTNATSKDLSKYQRVDEGDFVLNNQQAWRGSVGVSKYTGIVSPAYIVLSLNDALVPKYADYLFRSDIMVNQYAVNSKGVGSIQRNLYWSSLKRVLVPVPMYDEQEKMVKFLDWKISKINRLISVKKKQIGLLIEQRQCIIDHAIFGGISECKDDKDSGVFWIGKIPQTWDVLKIKWLFEEDNNRNDEENAELLSFSRKKGLVPYSETSDKDPSASDLSKYRLVKPGQLLENRMQAWSGMFICVDKEGCVSPDYSVFNKRRERYVNVKFYEYVFRSPRQVEQFANASRGIGNGFNRLYTPAFGSIYTVYPPKEEQDGVVDFLDKATSQFDLAISLKESQIEVLHDLKKKLIHDVVTGQMNVENTIVPEFEFEDEIYDFEEDTYEVDEESTDEEV